MERIDHIRRYRVAVTGVGAVCPIGLDILGLWDSLMNGRSGIDFISSFDTKDFMTKFAA